MNSHLKKNILIDYHCDYRIPRYHSTDVLH